MDHQESSPLQAFTLPLDFSTRTFTPPKLDKSALTVIEICAGAGGEALGLELAGFQHLAAIEIDGDACKTLRANRPNWSIVQSDVRSFDGRGVSGVDLFAGGVPCPPFSIAGHQLGADDERDLFPEALRLIGEMSPKAIMLENVRGLASARFASYRHAILSRLAELGYEADWRVLNASDFGVPQLRPRFILVAMRPPAMKHFVWPTPIPKQTTVGESIGDLMASAGWSGAKQWAALADKVAPTIVGGSKKHGGPDLGPTRARRQWRELGVDGICVARTPPDASHPMEHLPRLTVQMVARIQGFPDAWQFVGNKTAAYRQVGNAFPPPVAAAVGRSIAKALRTASLFELPASGQFATDRTVGTSA